MRKKKKKVKNYFSANETIENRTSISRSNQKVVVHTFEEMKEALINNNSLSKDDFISPKNIPTLSINSIELKDVKPDYSHLKQGNIVYIDLGEGQGSEESGEHPCYIVSNRLGNMHGPTIVVAPISSQLKNLPTHYTIYDFEKYGLEKTSQILFEQLRTVDKSRIKSDVVGHLDFDIIMNELFMTLGFSVKSDKKGVSNNELCIHRVIG